MFLVDDKINSSRHSHFEWMNYFLFFLLTPSNRHFLVPNVWDLSAYFILYTKKLCSLELVYLGMGFLIFHFRFPVKLIFLLYVALSWSWRKRKLSFHFCQPSPLSTLWMTCTIFFLKDNQPLLYHQSPMLFNVDYWLITFYILIKTILLELHTGLF